ncbi:TadE/TadG family type IV pilus assembly protein [Hydrogenophaga sp.]|uniref:TadE/TadG family type IV pilus assembly protein n=1 Tax=Hydrogenophaga sp. TaxID=1904254 RepID=UPI002AC991FA|nr:TadE/TadG family type IV pilus assembly protein [Hydrogenophaga sp.]
MTMIFKPGLNIARQRGAAAVEMAIIIVPMVTLCFGITELGRALYQYNGLVKATRGAARYLSQQNLASPAAGQTADGIRTNARSLALCGAFDCASRPPLVTNLTIAMISVCDPVSCAATHANVSTGEGTTSLVSVVIGSGDNRFAFTSLVPLIIPSINFGPVGITMAASTN